MQQVRSGKLCMRLPLTVSREAALTPHLATRVRCACLFRLTPLHQPQEDVSAVSETWMLLAASTITVGWVGVINSGV